LSNNVEYHVVELYIAFYTVLLSATDVDILLLPVRYYLLPNIQDG